MSVAVSASTGRPYGLAQVCRVWRVARATVYRQRQPGVERPRSRPAPAGPMSDAELVAAIRALLGESPFHGEGYRKIPPRACCARFLLGSGSIVS